MRSFTLRLLVVCASLVAACLGSDPRPTDSSPDSAPDGGAPAGAFALLDVPAQVVLAPGESMDLPIVIRRDGYTGPVDVTLDPLPKGIGATPLVIAAGKSDDVVKLTATSDAAQSLGVVQVIARAQPSLVQQKQLSVIVRGRAGDRDITFGDQGGNVVVSGIVPRTVARMNDDGVAVLGEGATFHGIGRVLPSGKLDTAFGTNGVATLRDSSGRYAQLVVQKDGKLLAAGRSDDYAKLFIHRLLPNGTYDATFGTDGIVSLAIDNGFFGIALDEMERIIVGSFPAKFRRLTSSGTVDTSFDETVSTSADGWASLLARGSTPIAVGFSQVEAERSAIGVSFVTSPTSKVEHSIDTWATLNVWSTIFDDQGRILVAGSAIRPEETGSVAYVYRTTTTGETDGSFGFGSAVTERFGAIAEYASFDTVLPEPSGKILCVGSNVGNDTASALLVRYDATGKRDLGFGDQGVVKETKAAGAEHGGAVLQTTVPTVVLARRYDPDSTVLLRYWR